MQAGYASAANIGGFDINYDAIRASGMGNTGTGYAHGAGSIFLNPGAISLQYNNQFMVSGVGILSYTTFNSRNPSLYQTVSNPQWNTPFGLYSSFKAKRGSRIGFGISINSPFSIKTAWDNAWKGRAIVNNYVLNTLFIQPTVSVRLSEKIGIGIGLIYARGGLWTDKIIPNLITANKEAIMRTYGNGQGWGINSGIFIKWSERLSMGVCLKSPIKLRILKGSVSIDAMNEFRTAPYTTFKTTIPLPYVISAGIGFRSFRKFLISAEVSYIGWSVWDSTNITYDSLANKLPPYNRALNLRNTLTLKSGIEWRVDERMALRIGAYYALSPVRDGFVSPEYPDANRIGITGGAGFDIGNNFQIQLSAKYEFTGERTFAFHQEGFAGIYKLNGYATGLSLSYDF